MHLTHQPMLVRKKASGNSSRLVGFCGYVTYDYLIHMLNRQTLFFISSSQLPEYHASMAYDQYSPYNVGKLEASLR